MTWITKVSKPGFNVLTETNPDNLIFSSDYNTLKYYVSGNYQMVTNTTTNVTIAHNLGYVPFFVVFVNDFIVTPAGYNFVEYYNDPAGKIRAARAYADSTNIYLSYNQSGDATVYTINYYYKIFTNSLGL